MSSRFETFAVRVLIVASVGLMVAVALGISGLFVWATVMAYSDAAWAGLMLSVLGLFMLAPLGLLVGLVFTWAREDWE